MGKLNALKAKSLREPGRYSDENGLALHIRDSGSRAWVLRIQQDGRRRDFGLGSADTIGLAEARERANELRKQVRSGLDPMVEKRSAKEKRDVPSFRVAAEAVHEEHKRAWSNQKHVAQWLSTLTTYAYPKLGDLPVDKVDGPIIREVLAAIWLANPETARRVRQRIGAVLDWAYANGFRATEAPMRSVSKGLPRQPRKDRHHAALAYPDAPALLNKLEAGDSIGRAALRFALLTASRSGEVRHACWSEVDLERGLWTIPDHRMKAKRQHVEPLSAAALDILRAMKAARGVEADQPIFPGKGGKPLSDMTLLKVLRTALDTQDTVHGLRSTFRDWAAEKAVNFPREVVEAALAHTNPDRMEAAYRRTNYLDRRRDLMAEWASFLVADKSH